jgi:hypothetical protein
MTYVIVIIIKKVVYSGVHVLEYYVINLQE